MSVAAPPQSLSAFVRANAPWLGAGALMTFSSSFGQTFFIALFAGEIRAEFGLSHGDWGGIYTLGTLMSAALMMWAGGLTDRFRARTLCTGLMVVFALVCAFAASVWSPAALAAAVFGLRFCGQGMLYHTAIVSMGRWFARARGRAVAVCTLGFSVGEAVLPVLFVALIGLVGWRGAWWAAAGLALCLAPLFPRLLRTERTPRSVPEAEQAAGLQGRHWTRGEALRHWLFWAVLTGVLAPPVFGTAFFFHQVHLTELKGWPLEGFAALFALYVAVAVPATFAGGWAADRYGAARVLALWPGLLAVGLGVAGAFQPFWAAALTMALLGAMQGFGSAASGAFWPEIYGTRNLGSIRALATSSMVFATAVGPGVSGWLIDAGVGFETQLLGMAGWSAVMAAGFAWIGARVERERAASPG
ncbi:MAG: MFS transporter [Pseudomonadota bacterium]